MNSSSIKQYARERGADLVGIASIDRFQSLAPERSPLSIFPECRSVIVVGRRILRGALRGVEEGTNFGSTYGTFGYRWLEDNFLSRTTYDVTCFIETHGFEAVPLFGYDEEGMPKGRPVAPGKPAPNVIVDLDFSAQAAGLGEIGLGDFFITPEFGTRQRLALILTEAELEPDRIRAQRTCGDCGACATACPLKAIDVTQTHPEGVPGSTTNVAAIDWALCRACANGAMSGRGRGDRPDRMAAACARACVVKLEAGNKCKNTFARPFRKREPWALDVMHRPMAPGSAANPADLGCRQSSSAASTAKPNQ